MTSYPLEVISNSKSGNTFHTTVTTSLKPKEKVCGELLLEKSDRNDNITIEKSDRRFLHIQLANVAQEYLIQSDYNFTIPTIAVQCFCDCPGGSDYCTKNFEDNSECETSKKRLPSVSCFRQYSYGHASKSCFIGHDLAGLCCAVAMYRDTTSVVYRALYLDSPRTHYTYVIELLDGTGKVLIKKPLNLTSTVAGTLDVKDEEDALNVSLTSKNFHLEDTLSRNWCLQYETNLNKLGWFKVDNKQNRKVHDNTARAALTVVVENCGDDIIRDNWDFNAVAWRKKGEIAELNDIEKGVLLQNLYGAMVENVYFSKNDRYVTIVPKNTISVPITLNLDFSAKLLVYFDESVFEKFTGIISVDEFSNRLLYLKIEMAMGSINVVIGDRTSCAVEQITIVTNSLKPAQWQQSIRINSCFVGMQTVCLETSPTTKIRHCKKIAYQEKYFSGPNARKPPSKSEVETLDNMKSNSLLDKIKKWIKSLKDDFMESVVAPVICSVVILICLGIAICYWRKMLCCLCCKLKRSFGQKNTTKQMQMEQSNLNLLPR
uniref:Phlebovirus glycoprotein G2 fusion domain-containing protein n=1 Tax=Strigamia maritima TaxID=126957 RepID=T1ISJ2_STRMM